ncbi:hypothetical protein [Haloarchaeobius sp. TZWSO28]|uniref:hypothetical protein n=1 Tax=Haloarchaeobius sp. TZWSO28 TaxID=3446119 RepID=UPI003EB80619
MGFKRSSLFRTQGDDLIVANAVIWAALLFAAASTLDGTAYSSRLLPLLVVAALSSVGFVVVGVRRLQKKLDP